MAPERAEQLQDTLQTAISAPPEPVMIHEIIREDGERELNRSIERAVVVGLRRRPFDGFLVPDVDHHPRRICRRRPGRILISSFGYTTGFLIVVLGRQQLFTESTLTAVLPVLTKRTVESVLKMLRLWAVVLLANIVGTFLFAC